MRLESEFSVPASPADAFELLADLETIAGCIPGGEVGPADPDGSHPARITVKLGPMRMSYRGTVAIQERDDAVRRALLAVSMREQRGQGTANASMTMTVTEEPVGSRVATTTDLQLGGRAAQLGRGVVEDVAQRMLADMAACIAARAPATPAGRKPVGGLQLLARALLARLWRAFGRSRTRTDR